MDRSTKLYLAAPRAEMNTSQAPERLAQQHAYWRRVYDRVWIALTLIFVVGGTAVWFFTRNLDHLYSGLFYGIFPFIGLLYNHFVLFNPRRDPLRTQQRLEELDRKQRKNARSVALVNGSMLLIASPILIVMGVAAGAEYGIGGAVIGAMAGMVWLVGGLAAIAWWRRSRRQGHGQD